MMMIETEHIQTFSYHKKLNFTFLNDLSFSFLCKSMMCKKAGHGWNYLWDIYVHVWIFLPRILQLHSVFFVFLFLDKLNSLTCDSAWIACFRRKILSFSVITFFYHLFSLHIANRFSNVFIDCLFPSENIVIFRNHIFLSPFVLTSIKSLQ